MAIDALVFIIQTSLAVCETGVVGAVVVGEDTPPQTVHHTHTVQKKKNKHISSLPFDLLKFNLDYL